MHQAAHHRYMPYHKPERLDHRKPSIPPAPAFRSDSLRSDSVVEGTGSPSTISSGSSHSLHQPQPLLRASISTDSSEQRAAAEHLAQPQSIPSQPSTSPYTAPPIYRNPHSPSKAPAGILRSPVQLTSNSSSNSAFEQQRPLPSDFPPPPIPISIDGVPIPPTSNPWEHHHYISTSSQSTFPPPQDRYICATCNKAFSRPSSLKIHSHSHTGEKPFRCPHGGCGKAFSVRSNMKRHEKGCHVRQPGVYPSSPVI